MLKPILNKFQVMLMQMIIYNKAKIPKQSK